MSSPCSNGFSPSFFVKTNPIPPQIHHYQNQAQQPHSSHSHSKRFSNTSRANPKPHITNSFQFLLSATFFNCQTVEGVGGLQPGGVVYSGRGGCRLAMARRELGRGESSDGFAQCNGCRWELSQLGCCGASRTSGAATAVGWTREGL